MRMKTRQTLAALLALVMLLALAPLGYADEGGTGGEGGNQESSEAAAATMTELDKIIKADSNTVKIDIDTTNKNLNASETEQIYDLGIANVVVDLYKIADVKKDDKYDTYGYDFSKTSSAFGEALVKQFTDKVTTGTTDPIDWDTLNGEEADPNLSFASLADDMAQVVLKDIKNSGGTFTNPVSGSSLTDGIIAIGKVPCGLYLMVPHGSGTPAEYIIEEKQNDSDEKLLRTVAKVKNDTMPEGKLEYHFIPQLLSLPGKLYEGEAQFNTAYGKWTDEVTVILKPTPVGFGSVQIVKNLTRNIDTAEATFIFNIVAKKGSVTTYSKDVSLKFSGQDTKKAVTVLDRIPIGSTVTVTEVYKATRYTQSGEPTYEYFKVVEGAEQIEEATAHTIALDKTLRVTFNNTEVPNPPPPGNGSVVNNFEYQGSDSTGLKGLGWDGPLPDNAD